MKKTDVHIGQLVESVFNERNITKSEFARKINTSRQNITTLFKRPDMDVKLLFTISQVLDYDFMKHFTLNEDKILPETEVSIQLKLKTDNLDELLSWISKSGDVNLSRK